MHYVSIVQIFVVQEFSEKNVFLFFKKRDTFCFQIYFLFSKTKTKNQENAKRFDKLHKNTQQKSIFMAIKI